MFEAFWAGLSGLWGQPFLYLTIGVVFGSVVAAIPGLGGLFALAVVMPFIFGLDNLSALAVLLSIQAVSSTANMITSVLFGVPGSATGVATVFDGYPLAQQGQAGRAISASVTASAFGGVFGAVFLVAAIPVLQPIVLAFGQPEFFMMVVMSLVIIAYLSEGDPLKGLVSGFLGLLLSFVGQEVSTGTLRYTLGQLYLWDGLKLVPVVLGLYAVAEMLLLANQGGSIARGSPDLGSGVREGILDVFRHWWLTVRCSLLGVGIGIVPGIGGEVAQFVAYGHAAQSSKRRHLFGKGAIEGVIGPEAANNSKDGGSLIPTLAFGVPGSAAMAVLLGAFYIFDLQPGPTMLTQHLDLVFFMVWILVIANVMGSVLVLATTKWLAQVTYLPSSLLVPIILLVSLFGAYSTNSHPGDVITAVLFGVLGYFMKVHQFARAPLLVGLVLGRIVEKNLHLSIALYGWTFFLRPITLILILITAGVIIMPALRAWRGRTAIGRV